jgi:DNA repair protein SbcC/Rad50
LQITKVEIKNIKNHAESEFVFQPGVVAICGPNGSGKTTILEAIAWALFDHLDYKRDDFLKRGTKKGQVTVGFISNLDGREYVVSRDTGGGYSVFDPVTRIRLVEQKNQVVPWLEQHIGVEPGTDLGALFKSTIGVPQGAFTYDFTLPPSNRKTVFDQILKVEEYRKASDHLRETVRHVDGRIAEVDKNLAEAEGELKKYDETKREHDAVERLLNSLETERTMADAERARSLREVELFSELERSIEMRRGIIERMRVKLDLTQGSLTTAREAAEQARVAAKIVEAARQGYDDYLASVKQLPELERRRDTRDTLRHRTAGVEHELIEARSRVLRSQERMSEVASARDGLTLLAQKVEEQNVIEQRRSELQEGRGELLSLKRALEALDRELEKLRQRLSTFSRHVAAAESQRERASMVEQFEARSAQIDLEISEKELALGNYKLKRDHLESLRRDLARLRTELERNRGENARLQSLVTEAGQLAEIESYHQSQTEKLAHLRAELARDQEMVTALDEGGICPLLTEKCLNLKPGESIDRRFRSGLESRRSEIGSLVKAISELAQDVKQSRAAATETARLPHLQSESLRLAREIEAQQLQITKIEEETSPGATVSETEIRNLKELKSNLDLQLREARQAARIYSQTEVLHGEIDRLTKEIEEKSREREELTGRMAGLGDIEAQLATAERDLLELGDPRSRAIALKQIVAREEEWRREAETAESKVIEIDASLKELKTRLESFASLDSEIATVNLARAASERDYQAFIANQKIAETVSTREEEVVALTSQIEETGKTLADATDALVKDEKQYDAQQHRHAQTEFERWRERATQIATQLKHTEEHLSRLQVQLGYLNEVRERLRGNLAEKEKALRLRDSTEFIRDILQKAAPYITESYLFSISNEANQLFREITGRYDMTLRWTRDYEITIEEEGRERPFLNLSGGEQMAAALSVRLALLKELSEINLAFFDEPTTNMDEERRRNLAQQIGRIKDFQQLFVISHDDSFEGFTDQIITLG